MLSIIVLSSDGYSDCWKPLFYSFKKYFTGIENYEIILSTNTKKYSYPGLDIISLANGMDTPWSKRLKISLDRAQNEIVMVLVEDFVLRSKINHKVFSYFLDLMKRTSEVDHIRLLTTLEKMNPDHSQFNYLDKIDDKTKYRFSYLPGLWKKKCLSNYVMNNESVFLSEKLGDIRSRIYNHGFYAVSRTYIENFGQFYDCAPSGVLFKGKWPRWVIDFFEKEGIEMDFSKRGFTSREYRNKAKKKSRVQLINNPITTAVSFASIMALYIRLRVLK